MDMEPTYFLYSGKLFHGIAHDALAKTSSIATQWGASDEAPSTKASASLHSSPAPPPAPLPCASDASDEERADRVEVEADAATMRDPFCDPDADIHSNADYSVFRDAIEPR